VLLFAFTWETLLVMSFHQLLFFPWARNLFTLSRGFQPSDSYNLLDISGEPSSLISDLLYHSCRKDEDRTSKPRLRRAESRG
jgi:hypothetical protein